MVHVSCLNGSGLGLTHTQELLSFWQRCSATRMEEVALDRRSPMKCQAVVSLLNIVEDRPLLPLRIHPSTTAVHQSRLRAGFRRHLSWSVVGVQSDRA